MDMYPNTPEQFRDLLTEALALKDAGYSSRQVMANIMARVNFFTDLALDKSLLEDENAEGKYIAAAQADADAYYDRQEVRDRASKQNLPF